MKELKSFEINKIYHITFDTDEFEDSNCQLDYENFNKNNLIHIHLIDRDQGIESNLMILFSNLTNKNMYYISSTGDIYYFRYDKNRKIFVKEWGK